MNMHLSRYCRAIISVLGLATGAMACGASDDDHGQGAQEIMPGEASKPPAQGTVASGSAPALSTLAVQSEAHTASSLSESSG